MDAVSTAKVPPVVVHHALRVPGDTLFAVGAVALVWFVAGLKTGHSLNTTNCFQAHPTNAYWE